MKQGLVITTSTVVAYKWMVETIFTIFGIGPLAGVAKLKSIVGQFSSKKYAFSLANISEVDVEAVDDSLH